jgi:hypothetical protein
MAKHSRRHSRKHRTHRRRQRGGNSVPGSTGGDPMKAMMAQSLAQGQQFANMHANQHGGAAALDAGPFPGAVTEQALLPPNLMNAARVAPLNAALTAIANMKDPGQAGGARKRKGRKASKKGRKASKKGRKASKKGRKASRKSRRTRRQRGGAAYDSNPASVNAPGMLLDPSQMTKALSGMNAEWRLAEDPAAFAPGVAKNY